MTDTCIRLEATVPSDCAGQRLDQVAAALFPDFSRTRLQQWIKDGAITRDGQPCKVRDRLMGGERLSLVAELEEQGEWVAEAIDFRVIHEDVDILVLDKPAGLVVHPGAGNPRGTLLNALLHRYPDQALLPRAGIVHRLDKDTSGLMVVARTPRAQNALVAQLQARSVSRDYEALVQGVLVGGGTVDAAIGRHPAQRTRMAVVRGGGKEAISHYRVLRRFAAHTHVRVSLETGRTHQIRVHMAHLGYPLVGDPVYGGRPKLPREASSTLIAALRGFPRQALHAAALSLTHPGSGERLHWESPLPVDMAELLAVLEAECLALQGEETKWV
ncbi:MAG: 23S rRNA pseudouridine(1911/1915/1917) synthase RluD [Porticoccaceae bacterium]|nr:23S rRNA pseudouridine(1911/1915/1917) synthase RluD [Porticoccaceae bacterium]